MPEEPDRTCKRCSVARVNALVEAYSNAHQQSQAGWISRLRQIEGLCKNRGFNQSGKLLQPGLNDQNLRSLCWNVSSFLQDQEVEVILDVKLQPV